MNFRSYRQPFQAGGPHHAPQSLREISQEDRAIKRRIMRAAGVRVDEAFKYASSD